MNAPQTDGPTRAEQDDAEDTARDSTEYEYSSSEEASPNNDTAASEEADALEDTTPSTIEFDFDSPSSCALCLKVSEPIPRSSFKRGDFVSCGRIQNRNFQTGLPSIFRERAQVMAVLKVKVSGVTTVAVNCWSARACQYHVKFADGHCQTIRGTYVKKADP